MAKLGLTIHLKKNRTLEFARAIPASWARETKRTAEAARDRARELAPVKTGALRGTIEAHQEDARTWLMTEGGPTSETPEGVTYALYQEFGTARQPGTPHFLPAVEETARGYAERLAEDARDAVRRLPR